MRRILSKGFIILLSLTIIFAGAGYYFKTEPEWTKRTYYDYYNQGVSSYLGRNLEGAQIQFAHVALNSDDLQLKALALYNLGTMIGEWALDEKLPIADRFQYAQIAIASLREAVWLNPNHEKAKWNLELLRQKQQELFAEIQAGQEPGQGEKEEEPGYSPGEKDTGF